MRGLLLFLAGLGAYGATLVVSQHLLADDTGTQLARALIALSPMLPAAFICGVVVRSIRHLDEMHRKLQFEALAMAFAGTALITFSYGFLEGVGFPKISMFSVWGLMGSLWFIGVMIARYRFK
ncbi:hypothetical protein [Paracoccus sp. PAR01]|uniref:Uncharacterized protein n=2 Tax=Paracoccus litorisediminis TaxID=2006130 RepID=A0A844HY80_9RHOB|nr:hypothetical protein [Paracoccus sp. PAR01]MBD9529863.1 hypothetical protein [Paracoccus sp. PAR01]MTH62431.1 hypothetical protein [Paracoccus litorisediminis]